MTNPISRAALLGGAALAFTGCGWLSSFPREYAGGPGATSLAIAPLEHAPFAGTSVPLRVIGAGSAPGVRWSTEPYQSAWVTADGIAHLYRPGRVKVTARIDDRATSTVLEVRSNPVARVDARRGDDGPTFPGDSLRIVAFAYDRRGQEVNDVRTAFALDRRGVAETLARVTPDGVFVADEPGIYTILVEVNGHASSVPVLVRAPVASPGPLLRRTIADADTAGANAPRMRTIVVTPAATRRVRLAPIGYDAFTGTSIRLSARVWLEGERASEDDAEITWGSSDSTIALIDADGVVSFRRRGWVRLFASHGGRTDSRRLLVRTNPVAHMVLQSNVHYPRVGQPIRLREEAWQRGGTPIVHARSYYGIVAQGAMPAATISEDRVFVAREPGVFTILAVLGERASRTTFVVYPNDRRCELGLRRRDPSCRK
ncbi:MAG TPA: hypothetical protein VMM18_11010 [Gemmatimonadaceae bacterium]|nr:hypothetical protein [Gemmatimonadaceae bacterium]